MSACLFHSHLQSEPVKVEVIQPDGSSKFEMVKNKDGETVYTKVNTEPVLSITQNVMRILLPVLTKVSLSSLTMVKSTFYVWEGWMSGLVMIFIN